MGHSAAAVCLPVDLAPAPRARVLALLAEVTLAEHPPPVATERAVVVNRCIVCHRSGVLGGHHLEDGTVAWIHKRCHRRLHRREKRDA